MISNFKNNISSLRIFKTCIFLLVSCLLYSCYKFSGSSLSPEMQTVKINMFPNNAANNLPTLSQDFTVALQNRFLQRSGLKGAIDNPHLLIEGEISDYSITPTSIGSATTTTQGNTIQALQNKLTITVKVHYENSIDPTLSFDRTYSDEAVFNSDLDLNTIETAQVRIVNERIINKIFNDIVANW
ncbi:LptE family protein [Epilithonimonas xixisoli]|uniref:Lipopolysaccharide assembly protein n=1 Tax=Epilithonimonas xixisoli TaxID=1476462 RepID=A0A4R8I7Z6_9FLAO|nr:LptE family protein [Epilithonimonas xixisoli]TDX84789.1 lipopolysaccharide assembly protein [Epilithonimonas xixisoli]